MKRTLMFVSLIAMLPACASTKVVSWNGNQFTVCGNKIASQEDFDKKAENRCPGAVAIGGGEMATGDGVYSRAALGHNVNYTATKRQCVVYQCGGGS